VWRTVNQAFNTEQDAYLKTVIAQKAIEIANNMNGRFDADYSALQAWRVSPHALPIFSGKKVDNNQCTVI
jgi:ubiquitin C-terminal hydrolase